MNRFLLILGIACLTAAILITVNLVNFVRYEQTVRQPLRSSVCVFDLEDRELPRMAQGCQWP